MPTDGADRRNRNGKTPDVPKAGATMRRIAEQSAGYPSTASNFLSSFGEHYTGEMSGGLVQPYQLESPQTPPLQQQDCATTATEFDQFTRAFQNFGIGTMPMRSQAMDTPSNLMQTAFQQRDTPPKPKTMEQVRMELAQRGEQCKVVKDFFETYDDCKSARIAKEWRDCPTMLQFFEEFRKFELGEPAARPAAELQKQFARAYLEFKEHCSQYQLPKRVEISELYTLKVAKTDLWRTRFTIKGLTPEGLEAALVKSAQDLGNDFRFSGFYFHKADGSIVYQFNNGLGNAPSATICEQARKVLYQNLAAYGANAWSISTTDRLPKGSKNPAEYPPENPRAKFQVPFGKTRGYTDQNTTIWQEFETTAIHVELGLDTNRKPFQIVDAHILSVGGQYPPYKEDVGLILAEDQKDMKKICRAAAALGQEFLAFEHFEEKEVTAAIRKK